MPVAGKDLKKNIGNLYPKNMFFWVPVPVVRFGGFNFYFSWPLEWSNSNTLSSGSLTGFSC